MIIYGYIPKSKPKKLSKAQQEQKDAFTKALNQIAGKSYSRSPAKKSAILTKNNTPYRRETPKYESLNTGFVPCTKSVEGNVYTGEKMKGVATMHKSNAVPVFTDNEAKEISSMRR